LSVAAGERFWRRPLDTDSIELPKGRITILDDHCKGCGFCAEFCPQDVLVISPRFNKKGYHPPDVVKPRLRHLRRGGGRGGGQCQELRPFAS